MKTVFISHGGPDEGFATRLERELLRFGAKTFMFQRHAEPGKKLHRVMRDAINEFDRVVLICSKSSLDRPGVRNEIEEALQREAREGGKAILIPITLDDYVLKDWAPDYPGLAQAIRDRVVADFQNALHDDRALRDGVFRLLQALADKDERPPKAENTGGITTVSILDPNGAKARIIYQRTLIPKVDDLDRLLVTDITSSGKIEFVSTNIGKFEEVVDEGGKKTLWTRLDRPLERDKEIEHVVEMLATDSYTEKLESSTFFVSAYYPAIRLEVYLPKLRPAKTARAWCRYDWHRVECPGLEVSLDRCELRLEVREPRMNALYVLEWAW